MDQTSFETELSSFHTTRLKNLTAPDGWLSVCGLLWIEPGEWRFGSAADNRLVIDKLPAHAGTLVLQEDGSAHVTLTEASGGTVDGETVHAADLRDDHDSAHAPTRIAFGSVNFHLIDREGKKALRVRDSESEIRRAFTGIDMFPADLAFRVEADWVAVDPPRRMDVDSVVGIASEISVSHKAVFTLDGTTFTLWPTHGTPQQPMFVFRDLTSGQGTYGASRFLFGIFDADKPGKIVLDFNRAINPPCAFTPAATCPLPIPENILPIAIPVGEKKPRTA